jgi:hypothetical protein
MSRTQELPDHRSGVSLSYGVSTRAARLLIGIA